MKLTAVQVLVPSLSLIAAVIACGGAPTTTAPDLPATLNASVALTNAAVGTPNTDATVKAALAGTNTAATSVAATVSAAVQGTTGADTPQAVAQSTTVPPATPRPTATPVDATTLSEEQLAALIDQAVNEAVAATTAASTATTQATADSAVTQDEVQTVQVYVSASEDGTAEAEALINQYYSLYGETASETLATVQAMEGDLNQIAANTAAMDSDLQAIEDTLNQGLALATDTINQLNAAAATAQASAAQLQTQAQGWLTNVKSDLDGRATNALNIQPNQVAGDRKGAIESAHLYTDAVKNSLADGKISQSELNNVAQLGANANASLKAQGGPELQKTPDMINNVTTQLARGELPAARGSVDNLQKSLPARPGKP